MAARSAVRVVVEAGTSKVFASALSSVQVTVCAAPPRSTRCVSATMK
jgi:hypothetical protein